MFILKVITLFLNCYSALITDQIPSVISFVIQALLHPVADFRCSSHSTLRFGLLTASPELKQSYYAKFKCVLKKPTPQTELEQAVGVRGGADD